MSKDDHTGGLHVPLGDLLGPQLQVVEHPKDVVPSSKGKKKAEDGTRTLKESTSGSVPIKEAHMSGLSAEDIQQIANLVDSKVAAAKKNGNNPAPTPPAAPDMSAMLMMAMMGGQQINPMMLLMASNPEAANNPITSMLLKQMMEKMSFEQDLKGAGEQAQVVGRAFGTPYAEAYVQKKLGISVPVHETFGGNFEAASGTTTGILAPIFVASAVTAAIAFALGFDPFGP